MQDRRPGLRRGGFRWALGIGLLLLSLAGGLFALVPGALAEACAYAAAPPCEKGGRPDVCTRTAPATVRGKEEGGGKSPSHWLLLAERGSAHTRSVRMASGRPQPVYDAVRAGDVVAVTYWRGEARTVRFGGETQETHASPSENWRLPVAGGLLLLPFGLLALCGAWWCRRPRPAAADAPVVALTCAFAVLSCAGPAVALLVDGVGDAFAGAAAAVVPAALAGALAAWWLRRRARRAADVSDIVPAPPTQRTCVPATVYGDVPYSVDGYTHLVVGDGPPAATPDPDGRAARSPLPDSLTVSGVRALGRDDCPDLQRAYKYDGIVIECRDGSREVRIATRRRDAPAALGALMSR